MPFLSANCSFSREICSLKCPSFLPCCCWSHSHCMGSIRAEGKSLWLAHQCRLLQKVSASLAWLVFVPCWQRGTHHSCLLLRAQGHGQCCPVLVQIHHQSPIAAPCDLLSGHQLGQHGEDFQRSEAYCCAPSKPPSYKAFAVFMHRRKGGNANYKYIGKMSDSYPGHTWEMVVMW